VAYKPPPRPATYLAVKEMLVVTPAGDVVGLSRGRLLDLVVVVAVVVVVSLLGSLLSSCRNAALTL